MKSAVSIIMILGMTAVAMAGFSMVQISNNNVGSGGLLYGTGSSDFLTPDVPGGRLYAR